MRLYDVFLRTGGAQGGRRTLGHIGEARLKAGRIVKKVKVMVLGPLWFFQVWALGKVMAHGPGWSFPAWDSGWLRMASSVVWVRIWQVEHSETRGNQSPLALSHHLDFFQGLRTLTCVHQIRDTLVFTIRCKLKANNKSLSFCVNYNGSVYMSTIEIFPGNWSCI